MFHAMLVVHIWATINGIKYEMHNSFMLDEGFAFWFHIQIQSELKVMESSHGDTKLNEKYVNALIQHNQMNKPQMKTSYGLCSQFDMRYVSYLACTDSVCFSSCLNQGNWWLVLCL